MFHPFAVQDHGLRLEGVTVIPICNLEQTFMTFGGSLFTLYQWPSSAQMRNLHFICDKMFLFWVFLLMNAKLISSNHQSVGTVTDSTCLDKLSESLSFLWLSYALDQSNK